MQVPLEILETLQENITRAKILVVGDVMLDRYWFGKVNRISPEAPVPIAKISKTENRPGGAANVARNIASLGGQVTLLSVIGNDEAGNTLKELLIPEKINTQLKYDQTISTIVKLRVLAKNQQLIRIDFEEQPSHEILAEILDNYINCIDNHDLVILSDYGKGGLGHTMAMIEIARAHKKPILIDPKGYDYQKYRGSTIITPNCDELREVVGPWQSEKELTQKAYTLKEELGLEYLLLTSSEEGMTLYHDNEPIYYPTRALEVFDVSGAGDTVIATLATILSSKVSIEHSVNIANIAAGIVIGKLGTATVSYDELIHAIHNL